VSAYLHDDRWARWAGVGGIVFAALSAAWVALMQAAPRADDTDAIIASWHDGGVHATRMAVAAIALTIGAVALVWFTAALRERLRVADERLATAALGAACVIAALMLVKAALNAAVPTAAAANDAFDVDADLVRVLSAATYWLVILEATVGAALVGWTSIAALRGDVFPRWFAHTGHAVAAVAIFSWALHGLPLALVALWLAAAGVFVVRGAA
jgi:hypothetical protein